MKLPMRRAQTILTVIILTAGALAAIASEGRTHVVHSEMSLSELEKRLTEIDAELGLLARMSLRSGVGAVGYQSTAHNVPKNTQWVQIDLGEVFTIDQVVLVPTIGRDFQHGLQADGFPLEFRILVGTGDSNKAVASFTAEDDLLPRIAPLTIPFEPVTASWVRLECTTLTPRGWDQRYILKLSEMMVFSGNQNVALQKTVTASSSSRNDSGRHVRFLVDGFVPYLMASAQGTRSTMLAFPLNSEDKRPTFTIDLGTPLPLSQINLHAIELSQSIPEAALDGFAIPRRFRVSGANLPDFSDQTVLFNYVRNSIYDAGPIISRQFPETHCRYVRITALEVQGSVYFQKNRRAIGFAEIEVLSNGQNVAHNRDVSTSANLKNLRPPSQMTDGSNYYGVILPTREWMHQLANRHELESERPRVLAELTQRYAQQKATLKLTSWAIAFLLVGSVILVLMGKLLRQRAVYQTRERIAANLHDELGANLHAIGLLGDTAKKVVDQKNATDEWSHLIDIVDDVRELTEETGTTARLFSNMLEDDGVYQNLLENMRRMSDRLLADLEHDFSIIDETKLPNFRPSNRIDLILFYKECLTNIIRHSGATTASTQVSVSQKEVRLCISDNGRGTQGEIPASLMRRTRLLGGRVSAESVEGGGTRISLQFRPKQRFFR